MSKQIFLVEIESFFVVVLKELAMNRYTWRFAVAFRTAFEFFYKRCVPVDKMDTDIITITMMHSNYSVLFEVFLNKDEPLRRLKSYINSGLYHVNDEFEEGGLPFNGGCMYRWFGYPCRDCGRKTRRVECTIQAICDGKRRPTEKEIIKACQESSEHVLYFINGKHYVDDTKRFVEFEREYDKAGYIYLFPRDMYDTPCSLKTCGR